MSQMFNRAERAIGKCRNTKTARTSIGVGRLARIAAALEVPVRLTTASRPSSAMRHELMTRANALRSVVGQTRPYDSVGANDRFTPMNRHFEQRLVRPRCARSCCCSL